MKEKIILVLFVGDKEIEVAVIVVVAPGAAARIASALHGRSRGDLAECSIAMVAVKQIIAAQANRDEQIQVAVVVVIAPDRPFRVAIVCRNRPSGYAREGAVAVVMIQIIERRAKVAHEQVQEPIVIVIGPGAARGIAMIRHDRPVRDRGELCAGWRRNEMAQGHHSNQPEGRS